MSAKKTSPKNTSGSKTSAQASAGKEKPVHSTKSDGVSTPKSSDSKSEDQVKVEEQTDSSTPSEDHPDKQNDPGDAGRSTTGNNTTPRPTEQHLRTVGLATRLACAQMTAEASRESARLTVSGIQRIAAAFIMASARIKTDLETLHSNPDLIDAAFVDRAYSDLLRAAEVQERPLHKASPLNHHDHDALFEGAMIRSQRLLRSPSEDSTEIHAEQLFEADETLSENQVGSRFKECEWPSLSNREDFYQFIVRVEGWFHAHLGRLHFPEEDERFAEDAGMMGYVLELGHRRQENDLFRRIYELLRDHEPPNLPRDSWDNTDELSHAIWTQCLINVIFCGREPSGPRPKEKRTIRHYRPWGLFRFLRLHGADDPAGSELLEELVTPTQKLKADSIIYPLQQNYPRTYDFGPLNSLVDAREREEMRDPEIQSAVNLEAVVDLVDAVEQVEMPQISISEDFQVMVLHSARSGKSFDPKWIKTIKKGFSELLLAGLDHPMDFMIKFLGRFYIPLLASYGALKAVAEHRYADRFSHELLDLLPAGWSISLSMKNADPASPQDAAVDQAETREDSKAMDLLTLTIRNGAGEERVLHPQIPRPTPDSA